MQTKLITYKTKSQYVYKLARHITIKVYMRNIQVQCFCKSRQQRQHRLCKMDIIITLGYEIQNAINIRLQL